jgi:sec-independent protein translocase protein TatA
LIKSSRKCKKYNRNIKSGASMASSFWELLLVLVIVFILFGAGKLPKVMGEVGKGIKSLRDGLKDDSNDKNEPLSDQKQ